MAGRRRVAIAISHGRVAVDVYGWTFAEGKGKGVWGREKVLQA
jgi:hypothetical protein